MPKVALLGAGYWGSKLARNLVARLGAAAVTVADPDGARLDEIRRQYRGVVCHQDPWRAVEDPDVSAVVIATPVREHAGHVRAALLAGKHVLVEKPFTTTLADALELAADADRRGRILMVGHTFLFCRRVRWIAERLRRPGVGRLQYAMASRLNLGPHRDDTDVVWDLGPHDVSILLHLLGEMPGTVQSTVRSVITPGVPDVAFLSLTFPSGVVASVAVSWLAPRKARSLVVVGDENMIAYDDLDPDEPVKVHDRGFALDPSDDFGTDHLTYRYGDTLVPHIPVREPLALEVEHFLRCVETGRRPVSDGWFGARVVSVLEAAETSWRAYPTGSVVAVTEPPVPAAVAGPGTRPSVAP